MLTPDDWQDDYEIYRGATFNLAHDLTQMLHMRPHNRFEDIERMYLVGGGTHPGSGLPVIYSSARITSDLLLDDLGIAAGRGDRAAAVRNAARRTASTPAREPAVSASR
jgi:phytoene desaturase